MLNQAFKDAVKRLIKKDEEYNYRSIIDISGGLDSRLIAYNAKKLGCKDTVMVCYSQSGSRDYKIAQKIANQLGYDFYFKPLDNAKCLYQVDENILMNNCVAAYDGITGGKDMLELLNSSDFGIDMTGLLGYVFDGSVITKYGEKEPCLNYNKYRVSLVLEDDKWIYLGAMKRFNNNELFWIYTRGMLCCMATVPIRQNYVEPMTPFGDVEFMETYFSIPWEMRTKGKLIVKWLVDRHLDAARIMYSLTGVTPADEFMQRGRIKKAVMFFDREVRRQLHLLHKGFWMNPYEYWCKIYPEINAFAKAYYDQTIELIQDEQVIQKVEMLMKGSRFDDKALSVLSCYKNFLDR